MVNTKILVRVVENERFLTIEWENSHTCSFHYIWLRDNCSKLLNTISGQRDLETHPMFLPDNLRPESVKINENEELEIIWLHDKHLSQFKLDWLRKHSYSNNEQNDHRRKPILWDSSFDPVAHQQEYEAIMDDDEMLRKWLRGFQDYGFARLINVPLKPRINVELAEKLSYVFYCCWGSFDDIKKIKKPTSYSTSGKAMLAHTDEPYLSPIEPAQILHCMENEVVGEGNSTLVDGFKVAEVLRSQQPEMFALLTTMPVKFGKTFATTSKIYEEERTIIGLDTYGEVQNICFSNHSIQPFSFPMDLMEDYYEAYCTFSKMLVSDEFEVNFRFSKGDLHLMDNHRLAHGRKSFLTGVRHIQTCYTGKDGLYAHLRMLDKAAEEKVNFIQK